LIPLLQWSVYSFEGSDHAIGWSGGRPILTSKIVSFSEPIIVTSSGLNYLIHPDNQGVNLQGLFLLGRWANSNGIGLVEHVTKKYYLSDY
jgi:hypothetical protein